MSITNKITNIIIRLIKHAMNSVGSVYLQYTGVASANGYSSSRLFCESRSDCKAKPKLQYQCIHSISPNIQDLPNRTWNLPFSFSIFADPVSAFICVFSVRETNNVYYFLFISNLTWLALSQKTALPKQSTSSLLNWLNETFF